jgi:SAM-dependent methyltransferase
MGVIDKHGLLPRLATLSPVVLELGCGAAKRDAAAIGIDQLDYDCVDLVGDALEILGAISDASVDRIYSSHFLEHVSDLPAIVREIERVLRVGGTLEAVAPHFANPYFSSDPTHNHRFGLYTFSYFSDDRILRRRVPTYAHQLRLKLLDVRLVFKSTRPFFVRHILKRSVGLIVNSCRYMQEFHEELLCYLVAPYEVRYMLKKVV